MAGVGLEKFDGGDHGGKDAEEKDCDFLDGGEGELIGAVDLGRGGFEGEEGGGDHHELAAEDQIQGGKEAAGAVGNSLDGIDQAGAEDGEDDEADEAEIVGADDFDGAADIGAMMLALLLAMVESVEDEEHDQEDGDGKGPDGLKL